MYNPNTKLWVFFTVDSDVQVSLVNRVIFFIPGYNQKVYGIALKEIPVELLHYI